MEEARFQVAPIQDLLSFVSLQLRTQRLSRNSKLAGSFAFVAVRGASSAAADITF
jgi:hypothetical protein